MEIHEQARESTAKLEYFEKFANKLKEYGLTKNDVKSIIKNVYDYYLPEEATFVFDELGVK